MCDLTTKLKMALLCINRVKEKDPIYKYALNKDMKNLFVEKLRTETSGTIETKNSYCVKLNKVVKNNIPIRIGSKIIFSIITIPEYINCGNNKKVMKWAFPNAKFDSIDEKKNIIYYELFEPCKTCKRYGTCKNDYVSPLYSEKLNSNIFKHHDICLDCNMGCKFCGKSKYLYTIKELHTLKKRRMHLRPTVCIKCDPKDNCKICK